MLEITSNAQTNAGKCVTSNMASACNQQSRIPDSDWPKRHCMIML